MKLRELLALIGARSERDVRVYLAGRVLLLAASEEELRDTLRAFTLPPWVPAESLSRARLSPAVSFKAEGRAGTAVLSDLRSMDEALKLANKLVSRLLDDMPLGVERVDVIASFSASEDGGVASSYAVVVKFASELREKVSRVLSELVGPCDS